MEGNHAQKQVNARQSMMTNVGLVTTAHKTAAAGMIDCLTSISI